MAAYRKQVTIKNPKRVVLSDLPLKARDQVEIVIEREQKGRSAKAGAWGKLFEKIDRLPRARRVSEEEIAKEIRALRSRR